MLSVFKQLVRRIASAMEGVMLACRGAELQSKVQAGRKRPRMLLRSVPLAEQLDQAARPAVAECRMACRRLQFEGATTLSMAVDATRAGGRALFVGFLARPDNTACWAPPQVIVL